MTSRPEPIDAGHKRGCYNNERPSNVPLAFRIPMDGYDWLRAITIRRGLHSPPMLVRSIIDEAIANDRHAKSTYPSTNSRILIE